MKVMSVYNKSNEQKMTAGYCSSLLDKFFRGCKTITKMEAKIQEHGGYDSSAIFISRFL